MEDGRKMSARAEVGRDIGAGGKGGGWKFRLADFFWLAGKKFWFFVTQNRTSCLIWENLSQNESER